MVEPALAPIETSGTLAQKVLDRLGFRAAWRVDDDGEIVNESEFPSVAA